MDVTEIDPCTDPRWSKLVDRHPAASVFHTAEWLQALRRTYRYVPSVLTTTQPGTCDLENGLVFCRVHSWVTGCRLVSLPFSDHCEPLIDEGEDAKALIAAWQEIARTENCDYIELRPASQSISGVGKAESPETFFLDRIDLRKGCDEVYGRLHRDCVRRRIRHAEREGVIVTVSNDQTSVGDFYRLVVETRRRQGLLPQPIEWFRNLMTAMPDRAAIRLAWHNRRPIAGILTLRHRKCMYYKYGASVSELNKLGGMPYLLWSAIKEACNMGLDTFDLGRSEVGNPGLVTFKDRWGAERSTVNYLRWSSKPRRPFSEASWKTRLLGSVCRHMPDACLSIAGDLVYPHIA